MKVERKFARLLCPIAHNQIIYMRARDHGDPPAPDSDDTADDVQTNVYTRMHTLRGLPTHSCALHQRGEKSHLAGLRSRPDGFR